MLMQISYQNAKALTLARIDEVLARFPEAEKDMPRLVVRGYAFSWAKLRGEVARDSEIGRAYVLEHMTGLGYSIV